MEHNSESYRVLFLCTGNSARSILGEYLLRQFGGPRFETQSAGASPTGSVNPYAIKVLSDQYGIDASDARSKSWEEFRNVDFDFVITVCDNARESCPLWPGQPVVAHWSSPDPALAQGSDLEKPEIFKQVALQIQRRIELFASLPFRELDLRSLTEMTDDIGNLFL